MKNLFNAILRLLVKVALHGYFKKIIVEGKENLPKNRPVILVANHQNALIDPLLLATHTRLNPWFLTRAAVFTNPFVCKLLHLIRMLPVYRLRDGFSTIQQNQQTFDDTYEVLRENGTVIIFAEGSHSLIRNLRPLSKGFTRMAFGLKEKYPELEPVILPVGLGFSAHKRSGSIVRITFGKTIPVDMPPAQSGKLTKTVEKALRTLVVDIPSEDYDATLARLIAHEVDLTSKTDVDTFLETGEVPRPVGTVNGLGNKLMKIFNFPLYWLWQLKKPGVKDEVFSSTWKFLIGFTLAMPYYFLLLWLTMDTAVGSWGLTFLILAWITLWKNKNPQE
ncbi:1-acyl-sn-glycerol-3-phosphate acyltransferase [Algoriphagus sp. H41]|uniref:1-acyl-sn-glycerol-3-phosphate acyltransferase n=1 Tax=Algoriphagus oliviformis TaxID=2811231 RepID=A0ABS3C8L0_9BACT|nr:1-acyl-sn-glycerol-3-phosphate acyltransferase [Algoriphagus oliviformis]MBN7813165.1 1-acyl-sn-glycerol-3-phosphate acyltransferase [Algoriphagus oliviformis]